MATLVPLNLLSGIPIAAGSTVQTYTSASLFGGWNPYETPTLAAFNKQFGPVSVPVTPPMYRYAVASDGGEERTQVPARKNDAGLKLTDIDQERFNLLVGFDSKPKTPEGLAEFKDVLDSIEQAARAGTIRIYDLLGMAAYGSDLVNDAIFQAALRGNPRIVTSGMVDPIARDLLGEEDEENEFFDSCDLADQVNRAWRYLMAISSNAPTAISVYAFKTLVKATKNFMRTERETSGFGNEDIMGGQDILLNLRNAPAHYATLIVQTLIDKDILHWLINEEHQRSEEQFDRWERDLGVMADLDAAERKAIAAVTEMGLIPVGPMAMTTPVGTGLFELDNVVFGESRNIHRAMLEDLLRLRPEKDDYFPPAVLNEVAKHLKGPNRAGALRFLKTVAGEDINLILAVSETIGEDIGQVIGLKEVKAIDYQAMVQNKEKYGVRNLFTAWAIGRNELTAAQRVDIHKIEEMCVKDTPAVTYRAISAYLAGRSPWRFADLERLWNAPLFKNCQIEYTQNLKRILSLRGKNRKKFLVLAESPGKLRKMMGWEIAIPRFMTVMKHLKELMTVPLIELTARLDILKGCPVVITNNKELVLALAENDRSEFVRRVEALLAAAEFDLHISYGLKDRVEKVYETALKISTGVDLSEARTKKAELVLLMAAQLLGVSLFTADKESIGKAYHLAAKRYYPDYLHQDDAGATEKFQEFRAVVEAYLGVLEEHLTGSSLPDAQAKLLPEPPTE